MVGSAINLTGLYPSAGASSPMDKDSCGAKPPHDGFLAESLVEGFAEARQSASFILP